VLDREVDQLTLLGDARAIKDVELGFAKWRRDLVLDYLDLGARADDLGGGLDGADAADVDADRAVELQRVAAGGGLGIAEHHPDLHADLVDEDHDRARARDDRGQLAQRLRHQPRLQAHLRLAHLALDLGSWHQRRDRVDHQHVDRARLHQGLDDLQRLLAVVRLRDEQVLDHDSELACVGGVKRVLCVDKCTHPAALLRFRNTLKGERGLARRLRPIDFDHPPARQSAHAERQVEPQRAGRNHRKIGFDRLLAELHDRAFAELLFDLAKGQIERLALDILRHDFPAWRVFDSCM